MDIAEFQVVRSPRRISYQDPRFLVLDPSHDDTNVPISMRREDNRLSDMLMGNGHSLQPPDNTEEYNSLPTTDNENVHSADVIDLAAVAIESTTATSYAATAIALDIDFVRLYKLLSLVDQWLILHGDLASGKQVRRYMESQAQYAGYDNIALTPEVLDKHKPRLVDSLVGIMSNTNPFDDIVAMTRQIMIHSLLTTPQLDQLTEGQVWSRLHNRVPVLPLGKFPVEQMQRFVPLVREAAVADLAVVRKDWVCYLPGEIANIRNIMAGESFSHLMRNVRETENIEQTETEERTQTKTEAEQETNTELSNEVNTQVNMSLSGYLDVKSEFKYPIGSTNINVGMNGDVSYEHSTRHASQIAQRAVSRASSTVDKRTREWRQRRLLQRTEDQTRYSLKNTTTTHKRGVYRWVDRIDRYQTFLYPERFQLEFQLPEPATYYRARTAAKRDQANASAPPKFDVTLNQITPNNILNLANTYHASTFPTLPDEKFSMLVSKTFLPQAGGSGESDSSRSTTPAVGGDIEIIVPKGYEATKVSITGRAFAAYGKWADGSNGKTAHFSINFITTVGMAQRGNAMPSSPVNTAQYTQHLIDLNGTGQPAQITLSPAIQGTAKLGVLAYGASHAILSFDMECTRTAEAYFAWQLEAYDALFAAWKQWQEEWESAQMSQAMLAALPANEGSSQRNMLTMRDELKRQVIMWLLQESPFGGRPALMGSNPPVPSVSGKIAWPTIDLVTARSDAPIIQFLEQAFDWGLMSYIFYPYYWADDDRWDELSNLQANDPDFERFLRAGSARVIVPARKTMEPSVFHYLIYGEPFLNQPMPIPGDPTYLSIAREIQDLTEPPEDGIAGNSWEVLSTTTMVILDNQDVLPHNTNTRLTAPKDPFCTDENEVEEVNVEDEDNEDTPTP